MTLSVSHSVEVQFWCSLQFHFSWFRFVGICLCILWVIYVALGVFFTDSLAFHNETGELSGMSPSGNIGNCQYFFQSTMTVSKKKKVTKK